ncbi:TniQ family protein [Burkholderia contaminans]|uniref:TniQ family protein n=1 Tax=Burkholderia contaminans TaxID=488447 RepID=UPI0015891D09
MLRLPFVPPPYPDEILGSWLARIRLYNGPQAWRSLFEKATRVRTAPRFLYDIPQYSYFNYQLFTSLEIDYEEVLVNLTTLPYRLTFDAAESTAGNLLGTKSLPKLYTGANVISSNLRRVLQSGPKEVGIRYCPTCLKSDHIIFGEPYWHRTHQLPNMLYCHLHSVRLRTGCPKCMKIMLFP